MSRISELPDFPWDTLAAAKAKANAHPDGIVDLSVGTPIDATPQIAKKILAESAEWPGYPTVWGTAQLRGAIISYLSLRWRAPLLPETSVMPAIGTKELVAWLPTLLGLGKDDLVVVPEVAYPTYRVGAILAGAQIQDCDDPAKIQGQPKLIWINSPANPTGQIWTKQQMKDWVEYARSVGAILASDECYGEFGWDSEPTSVLAEDICAGDPSGLLAMHSLSKRSNIAGYRAGFVAGDPEIVQRLVAVRKHAGMMVPGPVQAVMT
ncbi:MAG: succinyldiaminopimelate transaminase, partial [Propionibacterium sp.]